MLEQYTPYILFLFGFIFIIKGGDWFVESSVWIASITGLPQVLIGITIVSMATTLPELLVSIIASVQGHPTMAFGNAIGSNICNIGLIIGLSCLISPGRVNSRVFNLKVVILSFFLLVFYIMALDGSIGRINSIILLFLFLVYILVNILEIKVKSEENKFRNKAIKKPSIKDTTAKCFLFLFGIILIVIGAEMLVKYGIIIASLIGIPKSVLSLTIIALGTSLPELVTSVTALLKGYTGISVGNIIGANILNTVMVMGAASFINPIPINKQALFVDIPLAIILLIILAVPTIWTWKITRLQSVIMVSLYLSYLLFIGSSLL